MSDFVLKPASTVVRPPRLEDVDTYPGDELNYITFDTKECEFWYHFGDSDNDDDVESLDINVHIGCEPEETIEVLNQLITLVRATVESEAVPADKKGKK